MKIKSILTLVTFALTPMLMISCKKDKEAANVPDDFISKAFSFNTATKQISPDAAIKATLNSPAGIRLLYCYLVRSNTTDSLLYIATPSSAQQNQYELSIPPDTYTNTKMQDVKGIRVMVKHLDNSSFEGFIKVTAFTPPLPKIENVPTSGLPDLNGKMNITGKASSENGLKQIEFYDDATGSFSLADKISIADNAKSYNLNYVYTYRKNAAHLKVVVVDNFNLSAEALIKIPLRSYVLYPDLTMMANGTASTPSTNSFFVGETGTLLGSCNISGQETKMDFLTYCTSTSVFTLYVPTNVSSIAKNYKCGTLSWDPNTADLKASRFRVLVPGTTDADRIYAAYAANTITVLNDDFFGSLAVPNGNTAKFDAVVANQAATVFNTSTAYLIWIRVPKTDGSFTNQLMRVKEVNIASTAALSTMKFDIMVSK